MAKRQPHTGRGPFRTDQLTEGDRYELSDGHPIYCAPAGRDHASSNLVGAAVLDSDPLAEWGGVDAGYSAAPGDLRAPDVAIGPTPDKDGWIPGAPPLAVEYAGRGQDEAELAEKIQDFLAAGTRYVWVVRLVGPRRVEVYSPGQAMRRYDADAILEAPGVLKNPVPVRALYERDAAHEATFRNLLQRRGYESLEALRAEAEAAGRAEGEAKGRAEGEAKGRAEGEARGQALAVLAILENRGIPVSDAQRQSITNCRSPKTIRRWLAQALHVDRAEALFETR